MGTARGSHCLACLPSCSQAPIFLDDLPNSGSSSSRHSSVACLRVRSELHEWGRPAARIVWPACLPAARRRSSWTTCRTPGPAPPATAPSLASESDLNFMNGDGPRLALSGLLAFLQPGADLLGRPAELRVQLLPPQLRRLPQSPI